MFRARATRSPTSSNRRDYVEKGEGGLRRWPSVGVIPPSKVSIPPGMPGIAPSEGADVSPTGSTGLGGVKSPSSPSSLKVLSGVAGGVRGVCLLLFSWNHSAMASCAIAWTCSRSPPLGGSGGGRRRAEAAVLRGLRSELRARSWSLLEACRTPARSTPHERLEPIAGEPSRRPSRPEPSAGTVG